MAALAGSNTFQATKARRRTFMPTHANQWFTGDLDQGACFVDR